MMLGLGLGAGAGAEVGAEAWVARCFLLSRWLKTTMIAQWQESCLQWWPRSVPHHLGGLGQAAEPLWRSMSLSAAWSLTPRPFTRTTVCPAGIEEVTGYCHCHYDGFYLSWEDVEASFFYLLWSPSCRFPPPTCPVYLTWVRFNMSLSYENTTKLASERGNPNVDWRVGLNIGSDNSSANPVTDNKD